MIDKFGKLPLAFVVLLFWMIATASGTFLQPRSQQPQAMLISDGIVVSLVVASAFLVVVMPLLRWDGLGFQRPAPRSVLLLWLPALYVAAILAAAIGFGLPPATTVAVVLLNCVLVGFSEEVMFRGILFRGLLARFRLLPSVIVTSFVFGLIHTLNVFATGELQVAVAQAVAAFMSGLLYMAIRIRSQSLYPLIVLHALWDFSLFMLVFSMGAANEKVEVTATNLLVPVLVVLPLFLYGFWLLRHISRDFGWMSERSRGPAETRMAEDGMA